MASLSIGEHGRLEYKNHLDAATEVLVSGILDILLARLKLRFIILCLLVNLEG
jgi:hypothetical protein